MDLKQAFMDSIIKEERLIRKWNVKKNIIEELIDACWFSSLAQRRGGYDYLPPEYKIKRPHNYMWKILENEPRRKRYIHRWCGDYNCCNPEHFGGLVPKWADDLLNILYLATQGRKPICMRLHIMSPQNTRIGSNNYGYHCKACSKLTKEQRAAAYERISELKF